MNQPQIEGICQYIRWATQIFKARTRAMLIPVAVKNLTNEMNKNLNSVMNHEVTKEFLHQYFQAFRLSEVSAEECEQAQGRSNVLKSGGAITR